MRISHRTQRRILLATFITITRRFSGPRCHDFAGETPNFEADAVQTVLHRLAAWKAGNGQPAQNRGNRAGAVGLAASHPLPRVRRRMTRFQGRDSAAPEHTSLLGPGGRR